MREPKSFAKVTINEAVTQRFRVDLVLKPVTPATDKRLMSRFLGTHSDEGIVLSVPWTKCSKKVFVPAGWDIGMAFELGGLWMQTRTKAVGHCQFPLHPTQRVDGLIVRQPTRILSIRPGRRKQRYKVNPSRPVAVTVWPAKDLEGVEAGPAQTGQLVDWSEGGLRVEFSEPPRLDVGTRLLIRFQTLPAKECPIMQGVVRHYTPGEKGFWQVGLEEGGRSSPQRGS